MPLAPFEALRLGHLVASGLLLGALATLPWIRPRLEGHEDSRTVEMGLSFVQTVQNVLLLPAAAALLVLGVLMVEGPWARFDFTAPDAGFLHAGATLWLILAVALGGMWVARDKLDAEAQRGTTGGSRVRSYWRAWTAACLGAGLVVLAGIAVMALRLGA